MEQRGYQVTHLSVPADKRFLYMVRDYVRDLATTAGLAEDEILGLELAAEEAFVNILQHAYPDGSQGDVFMEGRIGHTELILSIRDQGLPLDRLEEDHADASRDSQAAVPQRIGFRLIRHSVDEVYFENLGSQGKVLRLVKRLSHPIEVEPGHLVREIEPAPLQRYDIRPMCPDEAIQVARVFWLVYGYSYKNEAFYRPEGLLRLLGSSRLISYVAVAEKGEVVGHGGLLMEEPLPVAEMAGLAIAPAHRGRGLMGALHKAVETRAVWLGLRGVCTDAATSHSISQRDAMRFGAKPCGLELSDYPPPFFKALVDNEDKPQRESCLHCFKHLSSPPEAVVFVPQHHQEIVLRINENLGQPCRLGHAAAAPCAGGYRVHFDKTALKGVIKVVSADEGLWPEILRATRDLFEYAGTEVVYLDLPLAQPASVGLCELAETEGYFFAGIRPMEATDGDNLRLQRLASPLDTTRLSIYPEFGKELFDYVVSQMDIRVGGHI